MPQTHLGRLIIDSMTEQNLSFGDVQRRGGPSKATLSRIVREWRGARSLEPETIPQLSHALGLSRRTLGRTAAVDMGLLPTDEATSDALSLLTDALREEADPRQRDLVVAAARGMWGALRSMDVFYAAVPVEAALAEAHSSRQLRAARTVAKKDRPPSVARKQDAAAEGSQDSGHNEPS